jgi:hypothetical protein
MTTTSPVECRTSQEILSLKRDKPCKKKKKKSERIRNKGGRRHYCRTTVNHVSRFVSTYHANDLKS